MQCGYSGSLHDSTIFYISLVLEFRTQYKETYHMPNSGKHLKNIHTLQQLYPQLLQSQISNGDFDTITECKYTVPSFMDIGKLYSIMIEDCAEPGKEADELIKLFSYFISDEISDFQTDLYYQNPGYLECSYKAGCLLD